MNGKLCGMPTETNWRAVSGATAIDFELRLRWGARPGLLMARIYIRDILIRGASVADAVFPYRPKGEALGSTMRAVDVLCRPQWFKNESEYLESEAKEAVVAIWTELFGPVREECIVFPTKWVPVREMTL